MAHAMATDASRAHSMRYTHRSDAIAQHAYFRRQASAELVAEEVATAHVTE